MRPFDPLTIVGTAVTALLASDTFIAGYNWQMFESNVRAVLPRGYVNVAAASALDEAWLPESFEIEVVLEGQPKQLTSPEATSTILGHITRPDLATALDALVTDGSMIFLGRAERLRLAQSIVGEMRQFKLAFLLHGQWNVQYVPG